MVSQASESEFTIATCGQWANLKIETNAFSTFQGRFSSFKRFRYGLVDHVCDTENGELEIVRRSLKSIVNLKVDT